MTLPASPRPRTATVSAATSGAYCRKVPRTGLRFSLTPRGYGAGGSQPPEVHMLRRVRVLVVLVSLAGALSLGAAGASAADWAGLGDSYAAGPLIPNQQLNPLGCLRSDHNFAHWRLRHSAARWPTPPAAARRPPT